MKAAFLVLAILVAGCSTDAPKSDDPPTDTDAPDSDTDGVVETDGADDTGGGGPDTDGPGEPGEFTTVEPIAPFLTTEFDGRAVVTRIPADPAGLVFVFHGTGGAADFAESTEVVAVLNEMLLADFGFVSLSSDNRSSGVFDSNTAVGTNRDWRRLRDLRDFLISEGQITATTPIHTLGYSAGGGFAAYVGHAGLAAGWPIGGISLHQATGRCGAFGAAPAVPVVFLPAEHDETVDPETVVRRYQEHVDAGHVGQLLWHRETLLAPTRFARSPFITRAQSLTFQAAAVREGYFDASGARLFPVEQIDAKIEEIVALPDIRYPRPARAVLSVVLATHAFNGEHGAAEASFFDAAR